MGKRRSPTDSETWSSGPVSRGRNRNLSAPGASVPRERLAALENLIGRTRDFVPDLIQASPAFFVALNVEGKTLTMNRSMLEALGYDLAEVAGTEYLTEFIPAEERKPVARVFRALVTNRRPFEIESRVKARDGRTLLVQWHGSPVFQEDGAVDFFFLVGQDLTDRRQMERTLQESLERYRTLINDVLDSSAVGVFFLDRDFQVVWINRVLEGYFGIRREEVIGKDMRELVRDRLRQLFEAPESFSARVLDSFESRTFVSGHECHVLPASGREERWLEHWSQPIRSGLYAGGRIEHYHDITKRKQAEEALAASEEKYRDLVQNANSIIMRRDVEGRITFFNEFAQKFFGYREQEILGRTVVGTIVPEKDSTGRDLRAMIRDIGEHPERYEVNENENRCRDGRRVWIAWTNRAIRDKEDKVIEVLCVGNDITERRLLQEQLVQSKKMEAVGRLAGGIAHDFNNLLTAILGCSETMLLDLDPGHPLFRKIEQIRQAGERGAKLTRQLLEFSRGKAFQPRALDLNAVVANQEEMLRRVLGDQVELELDMGVGLGCVKADPASMEQIILHLAANAREAMPRGGRFTVRTRNADPGGDLPPGPYVELVISDTGVGMNGETKAHLFEPFFTTKEEGQGVGLGLATVYGIVKQHLGHVRVTSEPGQGSAFRIYLPRAPRSSELYRPPVGPVTTFLDMETVLLVKDGVRTRSEFCEALEKRGYTVLEAGNSSEAILVCRRYQGPIHLMVTDVGLHKLSGYELAEFLSPIRPDMKVLYLDGEGKALVPRRPGPEQKEELLERPVTPESLSRKIRQMLDADRLRGLSR